MSESLRTESSRLGVLRWQLQLTWSLAQYHLPALTDEACFWEPAPGSWAVRRSADGRWHPDWADVEPDPPLGVSIGWITWHVGWWWSAALDHAAGRQPPARESVLWPGSAAAAVAWISDLHRDWTSFLDGCTEDDLEQPFPFPWAQPRPLAVAAAWVNAELMKNVAELGVLRLTWDALGRPQ